MIDIYRSANPSDKLSLAGDFSSPLFNSIDGVTGGVVTSDLFVRNDNVLFWYNAITIQPVFSSGTDIISGANGFSWKLYYCLTEPTENLWDSVAPGNLITLPDIGSPGNGDITTYLSFWVRIETPKWAQVNSYDNVELQLDFTENAV